jgi:hypothetical protein
VIAPADLPIVDLASIPPAEQRIFGILSGIRQGSHLADLPFQQSSPWMK